jgi:hypothetical protein
MTERPISKRASLLGACVLAALVGVAGVALGCSKEPAPTPEQPKNGAATPAEVTPAAVQPGGGDKSGAAAPEEGAGEAERLDDAKSAYTESNFSLTLRAKGDGYSAGKDSEAEIVLEAKAPFHANDKYPYKFKLANADGLTFPDKIVKKDKAKVEAMKVTMTVPFKAAAAGTKKISGTFHFSVCTTDKCLIEKRALALDVDVK